MDTDFNECRIEFVDADRDPVEFTLDEDSDVTYGNVGVELHTSGQVVIYPVHTIKMITAWKR